MAESTARDTVDKLGALWTDVGCAMGPHIGDRIALTLTLTVLGISSGS